MLNNISVGKYYEAKSNIHSMHPLSKIICTFIFIIMILITNNPLSVLLLALLLLIIIVNTKIPIKTYYYVIYNIKFILIILFILSTIITFSFISGFLILIRFILIILYLSILTLTTPTTEIIYGLEKFLYPLNKYIKSNIWALNIGLYLRFIPILIDERKNILISQISRGIDYRLSVSNYFLSTKGLIAPALKKTKLKNKQIKDSMMIRLYSLDKKRCNYRMNKWNIFDSLLIFIHLIIFTFIIVEGVFL